MIRFKIKQVIAEAEFRAGRRLPIGEVADAAGINRTTLSKLANARGAVARTDVIDRLCAYFNCNVEDLMEFVAEAQESERPPLQPVVRANGQQPRSV